MRKYILFITLGISISLISSAAFSQSNRDFQIATRMMQQQQYADALPLLDELHESFPENFGYAERLIDCLIQLKQYDKGLEIANKFTDMPSTEHRSKIKVAELYHYKGEKEMAFEIWNENLEAQPRDLQLYINTARTMTSRQEYLKAVEVYKLARENFQNDRLFFGDIANAYMRAGEYESAINEWLALLEESPNQISFIQRSLLRYNDPVLNDITIVELNERLSTMSVSASSYQTLYQLQIWLLQENELYRRALAAAKEYENRTENYNYALFRLGRQLINNNRFELAEQAFSYYTDKSFGEVKWRGLEELANTYSSWAKYIDDFNLDFSNKKDSLYSLASAMLDSIETETSSYSGMSNVHLKRVEIALDHVFDLEKAQQSLQKLQRIPGMRDTPEVQYLVGRIHLSKKEYSEARIQLTRANKQAEIGEIAEKTRYFLALTDFYAGDYEFATIQLKSLGRQNTSYYANDALELRLWLQEGTSADTTGSLLDQFSSAVFDANNGQLKESSAQLIALIKAPEFKVLKDDAMLFLVDSKHIPLQNKYELLHAFLASDPSTPIKETLLWEKAKLAEQLLDANNPNQCALGHSCLEFEKPALENPAEIDHPREIYDQLILQYPQGFYAPYARERLNLFSNQNS
ncbi:MAG: tetratricopeptide repeat protein [Gracilimonas sp.]|nr:tetratricopeptide repeat protein [Gracilimonas sp.]